MNEQFDDVDFDAASRKARMVSRSSILNDVAYLARFWAEIYRGTRTDAIVSWIKTYMREEHGAVCSNTAALGIYQFTVEYKAQWSQLRPIIAVLLSEKMPLTSANEWYLELPPV
jgi:hypothetical protein